MQPGAQDGMVARVLNVNNEGIRIEKEASIIMGLRAVGVGFSLVAIYFVKPLVKSNSVFKSSM